MSVAKFQTVLTIYEQRQMIKGKGPKLKKKKSPFWVAFPT